ncbi:MAG: TonB-dependent receptor plug domain-containing protein, partial [Gammaproteobacteria bacterium]
VALTAGARAEHNPYTGTEWLPTLRLSWHVAPAQFVWAAASRTVRAPSRLDVDAFVPGRPPYLLRGGAAVRAEVARVLELGYRGQPVQGVSYSVTAFHNRYDDLRTQEIDPSRTFVTFASQMKGKARGLEMWGSVQATPGWRISAGLTALHQAFWLKPGSNDVAGPRAARKDPKYTAQLRSTWDIADGQQAEIAWRRVGALDYPAVPAYTAVDARYLWSVRPGLDVIVAGQNLNGSHAEYGPLQWRTQVQRTLALRVVWRR